MILLRQLEALLNLGFHEQRCTLVALIGVLLEDSGVVLLRVFAAFEHDRYKRAKLGPGVARVVNVGLALCEVSE